MYARSLMISKSQSIFVLALIFVFINSGAKALPEYNKRKFCEAVATVHQASGSSYVEVKYLNSCLQNEEKGYFRAKTLWDSSSPKTREDCVKKSSSRNARYNENSYYDLAQCLGGN